MKKTKLFGWALVATMMGASFSACSNDAEEVLAQESEIKLTSEITPSRVNSLDYQSTQIVSGQQVGITIEGSKSESYVNKLWTVGSEGILSTSEANKVYWKNSDVKITAYHPYNSAWTGTSHEFSVSTDQSIEANYLNSDLLWATATSSKKEDAIKLVFSHKLAKVSVTLEPEYSGIDLSDATISICGTNITTNFNPSTGEPSAPTSTNIQDIKAGENTVTASAIIIPQTVNANTKFIKVELNDKVFHYTLISPKEFKSGYSHNYTLTVKEKSVELKTESEIINWNNENIIGDANEEDNNNQQSSSYYANGEAYVAIGGELSSIISQSEKNNITSLKITGYLNSDDIRFIREMAGGTTNSTASNTGSLVSLDISDCTIVEGGDFFYQEFDQKYYTADNDLGWCAFNYTKLENISLPTTIDRLGYNVLGHTNITEITIPDNVTYFNGGYLFEEVSTLKTIHLPANLSPNSAHAALSWCPNLETITINSDNAHYKIIDGMLYLEYVGNVGLYCCPGSKTSATIKDGTTQILYDAFAWGHITSITIPKSVTFIDGGAFRECNDLKTITMESPTPPEAIRKAEDGSEISAFMQFNFDNCTLKVPSGSKSNYQEAAGWKNFTNIVEY